jgi:DNA-directed RNA polymerase subunit L/DNA-directed RNA polymerase alpha subunit
MGEAGDTADVKIFKNSTPMSNEMLADRIGLLPIAMPEGQLGWNKDSVLFRLKVVNDTDEVRIVTASDFECMELATGGEERLRVPNTKFFHPDPVTGDTCILALLKPMVEGQEPEEIHLEAYATLGKGREHARFNPTSQCAYMYTRDEDPARIKQLWINWLKEQKKVDPGDLDKDDDRRGELEREFRSLEIYRCYKIDEEGEAYSFDFTVESLGTMEVQAIVYQALIALSQMAEKYAAIDRGDLPSNVEIRETRIRVENPEESEETKTLEIRPTESLMKGFDFYFQGEDHTLGNMLQTWIDSNKIVPMGSGGTYFAAYKVPHPLRDEMLLRIGIDDEREESARLLISEAASECARMFRSWAQAWIGVTEGVGVMTSVDSQPPKTPWEAHANVKTKAKTTSKK